MRKYLFFGFVFSLFSQEQVVRDARLEKAFAIRTSVYGTDIVVYAKDQEPFLVSYDVMRRAEKRYRSLTESILFYPPFLKQTGLVRSFLQSPHHFNGKLNKVYTIDGEEICYTFFDRGSNNLMVIGGGLVNQERVASLVQMFNDYDVVIFNHRGIEYEKSSLFYPSTWSYIVSSACVFEGLNGNKITFGEKEDFDVRAVVSDVLAKKTYENVFGLAFCYSVPIFIKAAVVNPGLFTKLILDGAWVNSDAMIDSYIVSCGGREEKSWPFTLLPNKLKAALFTLGELVSGMQLQSNKIDFTPYFRNLTIPVLFIHSTNDTLVTNDAFQDFYAQIPSNEKVVVLTTNGHAKNHLKRSCLYKYIAESFFALSYQSFVAAQLGFTG